MNTQALRRVGLALAASTALVAPATLALPASVAMAEGSAAAQCSASGGIWVVVDMPDKTIAAGCATKPTSGMDALKQIGVEVTTVPKQPAMICAIEGLPEKSCDMGGYDKATKSYWSYWVADAPGKPWKMSQKGAPEQHSPAGAMEGWRWGDGSQQPRKAEAAVGQKTDEAKDEKSGGLDATTLWTLIGVGVAAVATLVVWVVRRRKPDAEA